MPIQNIADISLEDIQSLIENSVLEGKDIEYKRQLPGNNDRDKIRFLATITSFANTNGGDVYYGLEESEGRPISANGFPSTNIDQDTLRIEQIIRNGVEPSIPNVQIHNVPVDENNFITVIRVHKSWSSPHRVTLNNHSKFYGRNSAGKYPLDVNELRT
jgi:predicted HTH transcriptional regulator